MSKQTTSVRVLLLSMLLLPLVTLAQNLISGHVLSNSDHSPVASASITLKGSHTGVSTGLDGGFSIKAHQGDVLVVSGIGIVAQEVTVGSEMTLTINVATNARNLNEVVVTATGVRKDAKRIGYAVQTI